MTPKIAKIAEELFKLAYEHDPMVLKVHEQAAKDKLEQLSSDISDPEALKKQYHDKIKEFTHKTVSPEDLSSILHVYDKEANTEVTAEDTMSKEHALEEAAIRGAMETIDVLDDLLKIQFTLEEQKQLANHIKKFFSPLV